MTSCHLRGKWERTWDDEGYAGAIEAVRAAIARGDVYQVNLGQHPPRRRSKAIRSGSQPRLHRCGRSTRVRLWATAGAVVSASPELFLSRRGSRLTTMPIKGTRPAGEDVEGEKDVAEHVMIVDLERNDLSRVCEPGSVPLAGADGAGRSSPG